MAAALEENRNLRIAWLAAIDQRDAAALRQMARGIAQLLYSRGLFQQAVAQLAAAAAVLRAGVVLMHLGQLSLTLGNLCAAQQNLNEALALFETMESITYRAETLAYRALAHAGRQDYHAAHQDARQAYDLAVEAGNDSARALAHLASGRVWCTQEKFQPALEAYDTALAVQQADNDAKLAALTGKARVLAAQGEWPAAQAAVQQMLPLPEHISFHPLTGNVGAYLAASQALAADDPVQAQALLRHIHQRLLAAAGAIDDPAARHRFLHDNPTHREILTRIEALASKRASNTASASRAAFSVAFFPNDSVMKTS